MAKDGNYLLWLMLFYFRTPLSCSTSHSGDRLYQSGTLKSTNDNFNVPTYRRKYISNKKPGIKPASHFTERCKSSAAPTCRTRSLHYLTPKVHRMMVVFYVESVFLLHITVSSIILLLKSYILAWSFLWRFAIHKQPDDKSEKQSEQRIQDIA